MELEKREARSVAENKDDSSVMAELAAVGVELPAVHYGMKLNEIDAFFIDTMSRASERRKA